MRDYYDILKKNKKSILRSWLCFGTLLHWVGVVQNTKLLVFLVLCSSGTLFLPEIKAGEFVLYYNTHKHEFPFQWKLREVGLNFGHWCIKKSSALL